MLTYKHSNKKNDLEEFIHQNNFLVQSTFLIGYTRLLRTLRGFLILQEAKIKDYSLYQNANYDTLSSIFGFVCFYFIRYFPTYILVLLVILVRYFEKQFEIL